jgi:hypothetical protein
MIERMKDDAALREQAIREFFHSTTSWRVIARIVVAEMRKQPSNHRRPPFHGAGRELGLVRVGLE